MAGSNRPELRPRMHRPDSNGQEEQLSAPANSSAERICYYGATWTQVHPLPAGRIGWHVPDIGVPLRGVIEQLVPWFAHPPVEEMVQVPLAMKCIFSSRPGNPPGFPQGAP
jgi:hypothetical protein